MTRIIAFTNQKGGVGKSTSVQNIAAAIFHLTKKKPLVIDLDPQSNLTEAVVNSMDYEDVPFSSAEVLLGKCELIDAILEENYCFIVPCKEDAVHDEARIMKKNNKLHLLKEVLRPFEDEFDFILIDCPASLGALCTNAFVAATEIMIPVECGFFALSGLTQLLSEIETIQSNGLNSSLHISGVIATKCQPQHKLNKGILETLREQFKEKLFTTYIRRNIKIDEAQSYSRSIFEYSAQSNGAKDYKSLTKEILSM